MKTLREMMDLIESAQAGVAEGSKYKCSCHPGDPNPDCPVHGLEPMEVGDALDVKKGVAEGSGGNWYIRVNGKILNDTKFKPVIFSSEDEARSHAMKLADKKRIPLSQIKLTKSWMDAPEQGVAEEASPMIKPPANRFDNKQEAFDYAKEHGGKVFKSTYIDPNTGIKNIIFVVKKEQGVAEGSLNEFAPDGFNGGDDDEGFSPEIAKMAQEDGFTKGAGLADGATLERAMAINDWDKHDGGIYKQHFAKGFKAGRMDKIRHNNKQYNLNLKLMKDGSIRHGEQGVAEG